MAQIHCNFFSYSLCHGVDIEVTLPSFTSCNMDDPHMAQWLPKVLACDLPIHFVQSGNSFSWLSFKKAEEGKRL